MNQKNISSLERVVEEKSIYSLKLKAKFAKLSYYKLLKDLIKGLFKDKSLYPFDASDCFLYLLLSPQIHSGLKRGLKALQSFIDEGEKKYLTSQLDDFNEVLGKIYNKSVEADIPLILVDIGLKRWLKEQISSSKFEPIYKKFIFILQVERDKRLEKESNVKSVLELLKKAQPVYGDLNRVKIEDIINYIENHTFFFDLLKLMKDRLIPKPVLSTELVSDVDDIKNRIRLTQESLKKRIKNEMKLILDSVNRMGIENIRDSISEVEKTIIGGKAKLRGLKHQLNIKDSIKEEEKISVPDILYYFDTGLSGKIEENLDEITILLQKNIKSIPDEFIERSFLGRKHDYNAIIEWFNEKYNEIFIPTVFELILEQMVKVWPQIEVRKESFDEARWIGLLARRENPSSVFFIPQIDRTPSGSEEIIKDYSNNISVMVYDIRGSSIMGDKLKDAKIEDEIRNEFQSQLSEAIRKTNGFLLKDTGDGGIVFFSSNSGDLYSKYRSFLNGTTKNFNKDSLQLIPSKDCSKRAVICAKEMIEESEKFVRKNLKRYKDWFKDFTEEVVGFAGMTYERLPPEYKKIFQIGIGIASGVPGEEIFIGVNVIGAPDLTGNLVRKANTYSKARHPDRSVILIDTPTMTNFLLDVEHFEYNKEREEVGDTSYESKASDLRKEVIRWMKGLQGSYKISDYKLALKRIDYLIKDEKYSEEKIITEEGESIGIKRSDKLYDEKVGAEKVTYEVILEGRR